MSTRKRSISEIIEMSRAGITVEGDEALTAIAALSTMLIPYITGGTSAERKDKVIADLNKTADEYLGESNPLKNPEVAKSSLQFMRYSNQADLQRCLPDGDPSDPEAVRIDLEREREHARYYKMTYEEHAEDMRQRTAMIEAERNAAEAERVANIKAQMAEDAEKIEINNAKIAELRAELEAADAAVVAEISKSGAEIEEKIKERELYLAELQKKLDDLDRIPLTVGAEAEREGLRAYGDDAQGN